MKVAPATIKDIAKALNVAPSTVSRALHDHPAISEETKKKVFELARELDYHPNVIAFNLKKKRSNTVGIIVPDLAHHYFSSIISSIQEVLFKEGYNVLICQSNEDADKEKDVLNTLLSNQVDGLLISVARTTTDISIFDSIIKKEVPIVFFDRMVKELEGKVNGVWIDDYAAGYLLTERLIKEGCKRLALISAPLSLNIGTQRLRGFRRALENSNMEINEDLFFETDLTMDDSIRITKNIISMNVDGIVVAGGIATKGCLIALETGNQINKGKIKVAGFMNDLYPGHKEPGLIRVVTPTKEMGKLAAQNLLAQINGTLTQKKNVVLQPLLKIDL